MSVIRVLFFAVITLAGWGYSATASADTGCSYWKAGTSYNFGTVTAGQSASTTSSITLGCNNYSSETKYFRLCLNLNTSNAPLVMNPNGVSGYPLYFNLYPSDNPDTPLSANSASYSQLDLVVPGWGNSGAGSEASIVTLIGRVLSGQNKLMAYDYYNYNFGGYRVKYAYASTSGQLPSCAAMPATQSFTITDGAMASATVKNGCAIDQVSNMSFGELSPVNSAQLGGTATVTVTISCPVNTTFSVALGNGLHSQQSLRNMCDASGSNCIPYQLYQDASHTQVWNSSNIETVNIGNDTTKSLTVYGMVPNQDWPPAGSYTDNGMNRVTINY
ncbi:Csu type fimbrial protein [Tatumella saanichensis]|uniref:Csu type fimbrial protein n=1 Tax=Tatumella saanichensis TaxID=480813 RepID=UPI0004A43539|nr:spore coat U domain-containing protein [Tatumella saanichensis]